MPECENMGILLLWMLGADSASSGIRLSFVDCLGEKVSSYHSPVLQMRKVFEALEKLRNLVSAVLRIQVSHGKGQHPQKAQWPLGEGLERLT